MTNRLVQVARNGKIIGQYPPEQLAALVDTGNFLESDICYSEGLPEWLPIGEFLKRTDVPKYSRTKSTPSSPGTSTRSSRHERRGRQKSGPLIAGWIAFLLAISALAGAGFWIADLYERLASEGERVRQAEEKLAEKEKEYQRMLFVAREISDPGIVRGSMILRNDSGKRVAMPGTQISLFPRKVVEQHLELRKSATEQIPAGTNVDGIAFFLEGMPQPLASTTTDASGRYEFSVPEPGEYVLSATVTSPTPNGQTRRLWFVGFNSNDPLNTVVDITETNGVQQFIPSLMIVEGR